MYVKVAYHAQLICRCVLVLSLASASLIGQPIGTLRLTHAFTREIILFPIPLGSLFHPRWSPDTITDCSLQSCGYL